MKGTGKGKGLGGEEVSSCSHHQAVEEEKVQAKAKTKEERKQEAAVEEYKAKKMRMTNYLLSVFKLCCIEFVSF